MVPAFSTTPAAAPRCPVRVDRGLVCRGNRATGDVVHGAAGIERDRDAGAGGAEQPIIGQACGELRGHREPRHRDDGPAGGVCDGAAGAQHHAVAGGGGDQAVVGDGSGGLADIDAAQRALRQDRAALAIDDIAAVQQVDAGFLQAGDDAVIGHHLEAAAEIDADVAGDHAPRSR